MDNSQSKTTRKPYMNPYLAGIGLGLTLLLTFVLMGRGLGASGGFTTLVSIGVSAISPDHAHANDVFRAHLENESDSPWKDWLVFEIFGIFVGGFLSGLMSNRVKREVLKGPRISIGNRLIFALAGGILMGFAAKLARGCTSGQALTGGSLLSLGSWIFMLSVFAGAYALSIFVRKLWT